MVDDEGTDCANPRTPIGGAAALGTWWMEGGFCVVRVHSTCTFRASCELSMYPGCVSLAERGFAMWEQQSNMEYTTLTNARLFTFFKERALDCSQKSMTARLAAVLDIVEEILARDYDRSQVLGLLIDIGWRFTPDSFDSALSRVRRRRLSNVEGNSSESQNSTLLEHEDSQPTFADVFSRRHKNWKGG